MLTTQRIHIWVLRIRFFYKVPYCRGKGDIEEANNVKNVVFSYIAVTSFVSGAGIAIYALIFRTDLSQQMFYGLLVAAAYLLCRRINAYYVMLLRANKDFTVLSKSIVFDAVVNLALTVVIVRAYALYGLFAAVIIMPILNVLFIRRFVDYDIKFRVNFTKLWVYIKFGFPLFVNSMLFMTLRSIDKIMIAKFLGLEALGFYSIALMTRAYGEGLSRNFNIVITPHFLEDYGSMGDIKLASKYLKVPARLMSTFMVMILGLVYISAPVVVELVLPKFIPGIMALKLLLVATFFYVASPQSNHFLITLNKQVRLIPISTFVIIVNVILNYFFIKSGYGITGVAVATGIASLISFLITLIYAMLHVDNIGKTIKFVGIVVFPLIYSAFILILLDKHLILENVIATAVVKALTFLVLCAPLVFYC